MVSRNDWSFPTSVAQSKSLSRSKKLTVATGAPVTIPVASASGSNPTPPSSGRSLDTWQNEISLSPEKETPRKHRRVFWRIQRLQASKSSPRNPGMVSDSSAFAATGNLVGASTAGTASVEGTNADTVAAGAGRTAAGTAAADSSAAGATAAGATAAGGGTAAVRVAAAGGGSAAGRAAAKSPISAPAQMATKILSLKAIGVFHLFRCMQKMFGCWSARSASKTPCLFLAGWLHSHQHPLRGRDRSGKLENIQKMRWGGRSWTWGALNIITLTDLQSWHIFFQCFKSSPSSNAQPSLGIKSASTSMVFNKSEKPCLRQKKLPDPKTSAHGPASRTWANLAAHWDPWTCNWISPSWRCSEIYLKTLSVSQFPHN